jgi:hypothetical protein
MGVEIRDSMCLSGGFAERQDDPAAAARLFRGEVDRGLRCGYDQDIALPIAPRCAGFIVSRFL